MVTEEKGNYAEPIQILEKPYHLAYPFLFEWDGNYYMIPESKSNWTIEVYKCMEFPDKWTCHKTLMEDITAVDATLFYHQQKWWLFANVLENESASTVDELFLFYADNPLSSSWTSLPQNSIVSDVRKARPAGNIFDHNGSIYRPSQNCSKGYGYSLKINRIVQLRKTEYQEKEVDSVEPIWDRDMKNPIYTG